MSFTLRLANEGDIVELAELIDASVRGLQSGDYSASQIEGALRAVYGVDSQLISDGTYFVVESGGELIACGGWSRRAKLYTGSGEAEGDDRLLDPATESAHIRAMYTRPDWTRRGLGRRILEACEAAAMADGFRTMTLGATLPGLPLYSAFGFREMGREDVGMPDGVTLECVWMDKPIA